MYVCMQNINLTLEFATMRCSDGYQTGWLKKKSWINSWKAWRSMAISHNGNVVASEGQLQTDQWVSFCSWLVTMRTNCWMGSGVVHMFS